MLRSMRYQNPAIRDHLASQYAMGLLLPTVKSRVEKLIEQDPSFAKEVVHWQTRLAPLNDLPEPVAAPSFVKEQLMARINAQANTQKMNTGWWQSLRLWQGMAMASLALVIVLMALPMGTSVPVVAQLSYLAVMQSPADQNEAPLVISAYGKTEQAPSRLELRWNDRVAAVDLQEATLWAIERETGNLTQISALMPNALSIDLTGDQWQAVKNSLELVVVRGRDFNGEVILRGLCLQLADWVG